MREKPGEQDKRDAAAAKIRQARTKERTGTPYNVDRPGWQYVGELAGVENLFAYVRNLPSKIILDIGAGTTSAIAEIADNEMAKGLQFKATVLRSRAEITNNLGSENIHITSAEMLRGIADTSVGAIIAVHSLRYSAAPELAAKSIDRVLVPGGVFKGAKLKDSFGPILDTLSALGYDIAEHEKWGGADIMLAIKPGNTSGNAAEEILKADLETRDKQIESLL